MNRYHLDASLEKNVAEFRPGHITTLFFWEFDPNSTLNQTIVVDDLAFGIERIDQFQAVGRALHERHAMPTAWPGRAILHLSGLPAQPGAFDWRVGRGGTALELARRT